MFDVYVYIHPHTGIYEVYWWFAVLLPGRIGIPPGPPNDTLLSNPPFHML